MSVTLNFYIAVKGAWKQNVTEFRGISELYKVVITQNKKLTSVF